MGKSASAYWVGVADTLYMPRGYRTAVGNAPDGAAHAELYTQLASHEGECPVACHVCKGQRLCEV
ncbi:NAD(P)-binding protein [Penicillium canescens]|nr:NAD(P)-binding protein [Penicillium canescens]